jgi:hypothetical protein
VAYGDWYYEQNDEHMFMENSLGGIETLAGEVVKKIVQTRDVSWLKPRDKKRLADFVAAQHARVPKQRAMGYDSFIKSSFPGYNLRDDEKHLYVLMRFAVPLAYYLYEIDHWELFENSTGVPFLTSDSPVSTMPFAPATPMSSARERLYYKRALMGLVNFHTHKPEDYPPLGFNIPLTPDLLLVTRPKGMSNLSIGISTAEELEMFNILHVVQSYQQLYSSTPDFGDLRLATKMSAQFLAELKALEGYM